MGCQATTIEKSGGCPEAGFAVCRSITFLDSAVSFHPRSIFPRPEDNESYVYVGDEFFHGCYL